MPPSVEELAGKVNSDAMTISAMTKNGKTSSAESAVMYRDLNHPPLKVIKAEGIYLHVKDFVVDKIIDAVGGAAVSCLGHGNKQVIEAMVTQMNTVDYHHSIEYSSSSIEELANELVGHRPGGLVKALFVSGGSEAVESAIKMCRHYAIAKGEPDRHIFISRQQSYHGNTLGAVNVSGHVARRAPYLPILNDKSFVQVSPCNAYRYKNETETDEEYGLRLAQELDDKIVQLGPGNVCAFFAETIVGATTGCVPPVKGYFAAIKKVCEKHGVLLVLDEIMSGVGRTGYANAWEYEDVTPDLQTIGKGLGGGYQAIAAVLVSQKVVDVMAHFQAFTNGHTYQAHPVACAAAVSVQRQIKEKNLLDNVKKMGSYLEQRLRESLAQYSNNIHFRGRGLFWGLEFVQNHQTKEPFPKELGLSAAILKEGYMQGVAVYPGSGTADGVNGDHILLAPPYNVTKEQIDEIVQKVSAAVSIVLDKAIKAVHL